MLDRKEIVPESMDQKNMVALWSHIRTHIFKKASDEQKLWKRLFLEAVEVENIKEMNILWYIAKENNFKNAMNDTYNYIYEISLKKRSIALFIWTWKNRQSTLVFITQQITKILSIQYQKMIST